MSGLCWGAVSVSRYKTKERNLTGEEKKKKELLALMSEPSWVVKYSSTLQTRRPSGFISFSLSKPQCPHLENGRATVTIRQDWVNRQENNSLKNTHY